MSEEHPTQADLEAMREKVKRAEEELLHSEFQLRAVEAQTEELRELTDALEKEKQINECWRSWQEGANEEEG